MRMYKNLLASAGIDLETLITEHENTLKRLTRATEVLKRLNDDFKRINQDIEVDARAEDEYNDKRMLVDNAIDQAEKGRGYFNSDTVADDVLKAAGISEVK